MLAFYLIGCVDVNKPHLMSNLTYLNTATDSDIHYFLYADTIINRKHYIVDFYDDTLNIKIDGHCFKTVMYVDHDSNAVFWVNSNGRISFGKITPIGNYMIFGLASTEHKTIRRLIIMKISPPHTFLTLAGEKYIYSDTPEVFAQGAEQSIINLQTGYIYCINDFDSAIVVTSGNKKGRDSNSYELDHKWHRVRKYDIANHKNAEYVLDILRGEYVNDSITQKALLRISTL
jgi:hypothetical protein